MSVQPPAVDDLTVAELVAVLEDDTTVLPSAGVIDVPAALEELRRRATAPRAGDASGAAREALDALGLEAEAPPTDPVDVAAADISEEDAGVAHRLTTDSELGDAEERLAAAARAAQDRADLEAAGPDATGKLAGTGDHTLDNLLMANGYNAVRAEVLGVARAAGAMPLEAIDAMSRYARAAVGRMRASADPRAREAIRQAEFELTVVEAVRRFRKTLDDVEQRQAARDAILGA